MFRRDRSLRETSRKISKRDPQILVAAVEAQLARGARADVLEIGFGHGRALLELACCFRNSSARFFGVDRTCEPPVECRADLRALARAHGIASEAELSALELPEIFFYDARALHFADESMDLVYSAVTIRHVQHKAELLEEVARVLRPGGRALLHIGEANWNHPYGRCDAAPRLTPYLNRFLIRFGDELVPLPAYLSLFEGEAFRFRWLPGSRCVLELSKLRRGRLALGLRLDPELSLPMRELGYANAEGRAKGGFRSVYEAAPEHYRALFERGILRRAELRDATG